MADAHPKTPVPPTLHEAAVERLCLRDARTLAPLPDADLDQAVASLRTSRQVAEQIVELVGAVRTDPNRTTATKAVELRRVVPLAAQRAAKALDAATNRLTRAIAELEAQMTPRSPSSPEAVAAAVDERDEATVAAVLRGGALLSGMDVREHRGLAERWRAKAHPEASARAGKLRKAGGALERAGLSLIG